MVLFKEYLGWIILEWETKIVTLVQGKGFEPSLERFFFLVTLIIYLVNISIGKGLIHKHSLMLPKIVGHNLASG